MLTACLILGISLAAESTTIANHTPASSGPAWWPQFRGPDGLAVSHEGKPLPVQFGTSNHLAWKTPLPIGHSSPCIWGDRIFLTGYDKAADRLETMCLDRKDGKVIWRRQAPPVKIEKTFQTHGPATPTPATDGERVYVYLGSFGLLAYDFDGKECWQKPLPPPGNSFGSGTSPVVADQRVLLVCQGKNSGLLAVDSRTGETAWKKDKVRFGVSYSVPLVQHTDQATDVILFGRGGVVGCDLKDGSDKWWLGGLRGGAIPTPALGDGMLFVVAHFPGGDPDDRMKLPPFDEMLQKYDANKDGLLAKEEVPANLVLYSRGDPDPETGITFDDMFGTLDQNKDGKVDRREWEATIASLEKMESSMVAVRLGAKGEIAAKDVLWKERRALPEVPSPVYYQGNLYLVKDGGVVSCFQGSTGKLHYRQRLGAGGFYYASPVAGDGKVYAASYRGAVVVFKAGDRLQVLARNDLGESIVATPAIADGKVFVRTEKFLYAFGL